jgi:general nucleoside transport system permease protein
VDPGTLPRPAPAGDASEGGAVHTLTTLLTAAVAAGTPLLFAALGEVVAERAGVINLGIEGMMLVGAVTGFLAMNETGSLLAGVAAALAAGAVLASVHAFFSVTLRANQIISGLGITIAGTGLAALLGRSVIGVPARTSFHDEKLPLLGSLPGVGEILFDHHVLVYAGLVLAPVVWWILRRTRLGLHLRAAGENPAAADAMGVSVTLYRYGAVLFGGALAGLAGATLSLAESPGWSEGMTAGRGWIALALVIFATWSALRVLVGAYFFGALDVLAFRAQIIGVDVSPIVLGMIPYLATLVVLVVVTLLGTRKRLGAPEALGVPYLREG